MTKINVYVLRTAALAARESNVLKLETLLKSDPGFSVVRISANDPADIATLAAGTVDTRADGGPDVLDAFRELIRPLHANQLSNALKHLAALRIISETGADDEEHVVVEDDVLFHEDVATMLREVVAARPAEADALFLGLPNTRSGTPDAIVFDPLSAVFKMLPCCDSYLIRKAAAAKLAGAYLPIRLPANLQLSHLCAKLGVRVFLSSPNVFVDGSKIGVFTSSIESNNSLTWNPEYVRLRALLPPDVALPAMTIEQQAAFQSGLDAIHFRAHPDIRHLAARYFTMVGRYDDARREYEQAFETFVADGCVFGPNCRFMKDYVSIFRHVQPDP